MPDETSANALLERPAAPGEHDAASLHLLWKITQGEALTPDEAEEWKTYTAAQAKAERERELLGLVDLAEVMREGVTEPTMLVDGLLVEGEHHLWYGNKESAKTWLALWASALVMGRGQSVLWVDKEMGRRNLAGRLLTLKVPEEAVGERFLYCEFPTLDLSNVSMVLWRALLDAKRPALVVIDAQTEVLADADLNENSGTDIEKWMKAYITPARRLGIATLMLDHTGHSESGRSVGSRQKGAAAKVELNVKKTSGFDRDKVGAVEVTRTKNTVAAPIDETQNFQIGGDGEGGFTLERMYIAARVASKADVERLGMKEKLVEKIRESGEDGRTVTQLRPLVAAAKKTVETVLDELIKDDASGVKAKVGVRAGSVRYYWSEPEVE